jgi:hypothetical protein
MTDEFAIQGLDEQDWPNNYFNYFTEIEEHFQRARGTALFLLSPLDWALIENWKNGGIPLEAVLRGIDDAFEKWRSRKSKRRTINSLAYCSQAVAEAAQRAPVSASRNTVKAPFTIDEIHTHLNKAVEALQSRTEVPLQEVVGSLKQLIGQLGTEVLDLEDLERRLTAMEDKIAAVLRTLEPEEFLYQIRQSLDEELRPYRGKMSADQLIMLERRYLDTALWERAAIPRLSLFYLHPI